MSASILTSPVARVALRTLGLAPLDRPFHLSGSLDGMVRLLFVDTGRLCDTLHFLPVIEEVSRRWPEIELQVMAAERWADLLRRESALSGLIVYREDQLRLRSSNYLRLLREVRRRAFDGVFMMGDEPEGARDLVAYASQAPLRIGTHNPSRESILNCMVRWRGRGRYQNELPAELMRLVGLRFDPKTWRFRPKPEEGRAAEQMIHFRKPIKEQVLIGVDPGPGLTGKRFSSDNLRYLVEHLTERLRAKLMLCDLGDDAKEGDEFRRRLRGEVLDMPAKTLRETMALISRCDLFLAGNTELFHAAVAMGVPAVGLFTESDGSRWEPRRDDDVFILRGRPGESMPLSEIDAAVKRILDARPA